MTAKERELLKDRQIADAQEAMMEAQAIIAKNIGSDASMMRQIAVHIGIALGALNYSVDEV